MKHTIYIYILRSIFYFALIFFVNGRGHFKTLYQEMWDTRVSTFFKLFNNQTRRKFLNIKTVDISILIAQRIFR